GGTDPDDDHRPDDRACNPTTGTPEEIRLAHQEMPAERRRPLSDHRDDDDHEHPDRKQRGERAHGLHDPVDDATAAEPSAGSEVELRTCAARHADLVRAGSKRLTIT